MSERSLHPDRPIDPATAPARPMRICIPFLHFKTGGAERMALRLASAWQRAGHEVVLIVGRDGGSMRDQAPPLDYRIARPPLPSRSWLTPWLIWCTWRHLRREPADVLYCLGNTYSVVGVAMKLLLGKRCPPIVAKVSNDLARRDSNRLFRWLYHRWLAFQAPLFARFVAIGPGAEDEIATFFPGSRGRIVNIYNPAIEQRDLDTPTPHDRAGGGKPGRDFVTVGRLEPQKNLPLQLEAFALGRAPGDRLAIVGDGSLHDQLRDQIAQLGLGEAVTLSGFDPHAAERMAGCHALILSSDYEGLGNVVIEALARGVPVIATDCSSTTRGLLAADGFGPAPHGWLVPVQDRDRLAEAIAKLDPAAFDRASARAMAARFTLEEASRRYLALFGELCLADDAVTLRQGSSHQGAIAEAARTGGPAGTARAAVGSGR